MNKNDYFSRTSIHTMVNEQYRISSIWREYDLDYGFKQEWAWETLVWKREGKKEIILYQPSTYEDIQDVLIIHKAMYNAIFDNILSKNEPTNIEDALKEVENA